MIILSFQRPPLATPGAMLVSMIIRADLDFGKSMLPQLSNMKKRFESPLTHDWEEANFSCDSQGLVIRELIR